MAHAIAMIAIMWLLLSIGGLFLGGLFDEDPNDKIGIMKPLGFVFVLFILSQCVGIRL